MSTVVQFIVDVEFDDDDIDEDELELDDVEISGTKSEYSFAARRV